ncbi:MAG: molybdopterin-dependent oxidoreductase [Myxococcales bacterium]|nr:molybdopterin-dependent oxidoreductase [Myxococcales bacterium]
MSTDDPTRRSVVRLMGGIATAAVLPANFGGCSVGGAVSRGSLHRPTPDEPLTPPSDFYVNANFGIPEFASWQLHVDGLVDRRLTLSLDDIAAMPQITRTLTLECIGNFPGGTLLSSGAFTGPPLAHVLAEAGLSDRARGLMFVGMDGYPAYLPVSVLDEGAMLVTHLGGEPLRAVHGAPLRALMPGRYGMFSIKWLDSITATREFATYGSLGQLASFVEANTHLRSRIDTVGGGSRVPLGSTVTMSGLAVTGGIGITRVQISDGGDWQDAEITYNRSGSDLSPYLWSLWSFDWTPTAAGEHTLTVRAWDAHGHTQDEEVDFPYDAGALHRVAVLVDG